MYRRVFQGKGKEKRTGPDLPRFQGGHLITIINAQRRDKAKKEIIERG